VPRVAEGEARCQRGDGDDAGDAASPGRDAGTLSSDASAASYVVGGIVKGLEGAGLVLQNGSDKVPVAAASGVPVPFELPTKVASNWEYVASKKAFTTPTVFYADIRTSGQSQGFVLADAATRNRYTFRQSGSNVGTTVDADVNSTNGWFDMTYPGVAWSGGGGGAAPWSIEVTAALGVNAIDVRSWCNVTASGCNSTPRSPPLAGATAYVPGFSSWQGDVFVSLFHARKYSAAAVTATVS
jgi:hypothetical protein